MYTRVPKLPPRFNWPRESICHHRRLAIGDHCLGFNSSNSPHNTAEASPSWSPHQKLPPGSDLPKFRTAPYSPWPLSWRARHCSWVTGRRDSPVFLSYRQNASNEKLNEEEDESRTWNLHLFRWNNFTFFLFFFFFPSLNITSPSFFNWCFGNKTKEESLVGRGGVASSDFGQCNFWD